MKNMLLVILSVFSVTCEAHDSDTAMVVFWNLENFFDYTDQGTGESDSVFSSFGERRWTKKKFQAKCDAVAKSLLWMGERYGRLPDLVGLAEIENRGVLNRLLNTTLLRKYDYRIIHRDSGDRRGIDVALLYRKSIYDLISYSLKTPQMDGQKLPTRDILHVCLKDRTGNEINFIVNHHPSKFGGAKSSEMKRNAAMLSLKQICDSIASVSVSPVIVMGDFNDTPDGNAFRILDGTLVNKGNEFHERGEGTIRYEGKWELIDMFMVSPELDGRSVMEICRIPFLMIRDSKHQGEKPFRTYSGPRYIGGVSDHCPAVLLLEWDKSGIE